MRHKQTHNENGPNRFIADNGSKDVSNMGYNGVSFWSFLCIGRKLRERKVLATVLRPLLDNREVCP